MFIGSLQDTPTGAHSFSTQKLMKIEGSFKKIENSVLGDNDVIRITF